jgi:putative transposase
MSFTKVYIHFVWSTKNRVPYLSTLDLRLAMWKHIRENAEKKAIYIDFVSGHKEHCHCLVSLGDDQTMRKIMQLIKGESSYWMNKQNIIEGKFEWQDEYYAVSVSESLVNIVRDYIKNQEKHHAHKTWENEYNEFIEKFGFERFKDYDDD